jgi:hypothetical protein
MTVMRTEYLNLNTGTVRTGPTGHGESLIDMESYLLPLDQARGSSLSSFGVATGLGVRATIGQLGVTVAVGAALDAAGRLAVLAADGSAVVDPNVDPDELQNIPTVPVPAGGLVLDTAGVSGDRFLTLRWREVFSETALANVRVLLHAPWLRLMPVSGFQDVGEQVVLARVELDASGNVTGLSAEGRRLVVVVGGRVELRVPRVQSGPGLEEVGAGELRARADGGVELAVGSGAGLRPALSAEPATGNLLRLSIGTDTVDIPSGRLGLGTPPLARLHAKDSGGFGPDDPTGVVTGSSVPLLAQSDSTAIGALNADGRAAFALDIDDNDHSNGERGVPTLCDFFDGTRHQAISIKLGRVGIGTQNPTERLTVSGAGARVHGVAIGTSVDGVSYDFARDTVGVSDASASLRLQSPDSIIFHSGGNPPDQRMVLDRSGRLRVGLAGTPTEDTLEVAGTARLCVGTNPIRFTDRWSAFPDAATNRAEISNDTGTFKTLMIVGNKSGPPGVRKVSVWDRLEVNGVSCANSFCNLSDARLKTDIEALAEPLDAVGRLRAVSFRWREGLAGADGEPSGGELAGVASIGVLAEEVAEVYPELVTTMGVDEYLAVDYPGLTAVLVEAVKELKAESERLRRRLDDLGRRESAVAGDR